MMGTGCFITGTGTEVGKTIVTAALLRALRRSGMDAVSMKPVQTGALATNAGLRAQDLDVHRAAAELPPASMEALETLAPYRYPEACSPHLAGRIAGAYPNIERIRAAAESLRALHEAVLVEGAGGVLVPLNETHTMLDLMGTLGYPVLLAAHAGLGTLNHTLLSLQALRGAGLEVLGVILCEPGPVPEDIVKEDNPRALETFGAVPILGHVRHHPGLTEGTPAGWDAAVADLYGLDCIRAALCEGKEE